MNTHTIIKKPTNLDWSHIPLLSLENTGWTPPTNISANGQICYDEEALYLRLTTKEAHIRAELTEPLDMPCLDSCLEFFFCPIAGDARYFNFEFNPNCCMYLGFGSNRYDSVRLIINEPDLFQPHVNMLPDGWELTFQIPHSFIRRFFPDFAPLSGQKMHANFYKCGDLTVQKHYLAWNKMTGNPDFHRPCDFGELIFE